MNMTIKKGDNIIVIAGKHKGENGKVVRVLPDANRVIVEGVNKVKRHTKAKSRSEKGQIVEREAAIHASNVMLVDPKGGKQTRVGKKLVDGKMVRFAKKSGQEIK
jgi:large subunit ribosomal protein L24